MRVLAILISIILLSTNLLTGQKCKYVKNEIDDFTGERIAITDRERIATNIVTLVYVDMYGKTTNGVNQLFFSSSVPFTEFSIDQGAEVLLKQEDGNIITLLVDEDMSSQVSGGLGASSNRGTFSVTISDELKSMFLRSPIEKIRIPFENAESDLELKKKARGAFLRVLGCLHRANK